MGLIPASLQNNAVSKERQSWWATLVLLCAVLGAMLGLSVKTQNTIKHTITTNINVINETEVKQLQQTIAADNQTIAKYEAGANSHSAELRAVTDDLKSAKFLAGLTTLQGPGVLVTLNDSKRPFPNGLQLGAAPPNIIHDTDINQVINELKASGAEAISVNGQRMVAISPVRCAGPTVFVNNTAQTPPYFIKAIGDPKTLATALNLPGGIADQLKQFDPAMFGVATDARLVVPAYSGVIQPRYAQPVSSDADTVKEARLK